MSSTRYMYSGVDAPLAMPLQYNEVVHVPEESLVSPWRNEQACLYDSTVTIFVILVL